MYPEVLDWIIKVFKKFTGITPQGIYEGNNSAELTSH